MDTFDVWTWARGQQWRRMLEGAPLEQTTRALVTLTPGVSAAAFAAELHTNPNRIDAHELGELAALTVGPILDTIGRSRHA